MSPSPRGAEATLSLYALPDMPLVKSGDDIAQLIIDAAARAGLDWRDGDIVVIAQKIISKAEGRTVSLDDVTPTDRAKAIAGEIDKDPRLVQLILDESTEVLRTRPGVIVVVHRLGVVLANAGIDSSNVADPSEPPRVLLLPEDPDRSSAALRAQLRSRLGVDIAVIINDSLGRAWRNGTVGVALGASGIETLADLTGNPDLFGRDLQTTEVGVADEIAAAASLVMGQANEGRPVVVVRGVPYRRRDATARDLIRPTELDMFR